MPESMTATPMPAPAGVSCGSPSVARTADLGPCAPSAVVATTASIDTDDTERAQASAERSAMSTFATVALIPGRSPSNVLPKATSRLVSASSAPGAAETITRNSPAPPVRTHRCTAASSLGDEGNADNGMEQLIPETGVSGGGPEFGSCADTPCARSTKRPQTITARCRHCFRITLWQHSNGKATLWLVPATDSICLSYSFEMSGFLLHEASDGALIAV